MIPAHPGLCVEEDREVWRGRFSARVIRFRRRRFDGDPSALLEWEVWERPNGSALLPYDPWRDEVVLLDQFRLPALLCGAPPLMAEIPAGKIDAGETAEAAALREAGEEVGLAPDRLERCGDFVLSPAGVAERCAIHVGRVRAPTADGEGIAGYFGLAEENEYLRVRVVPAVRAIDDALAGAYPNAVTTLALLWLAARREGLREKWR